MNRRTFLNALVGASVAGSAVAVAVAVACAYAEDTYDVEIKRVPLALGLQKPLRMVALGDIHFDPLCDENYLNRVIDLINGLNADLIMYTGDFISRNASRVNDLAVLLSRGQARLGSYAVPGNHEHWTGLGAIIDALEKRGGIRVLRNKLIALPDEDQIYLTGLDSFWSGQPDPSIIDRTPAHSRHIVVAHEPDSFLQLTDSRIKLQISGHTHGGQVRLPFYGALVLPKMGRNFEEGLFVRDDRQLYVNRGIGTLSLHMRINCRPEITVFELS